MFGYILRRLLYMTPILFGVSIVIFLLLNLIPGDPARLVAGVDATKEDVEIIRSSLGLDRPLPVQYVSWLGNVVRGDLGRSTRTHRPVTHELRLTIPATIELTISAIAVAVLIGVAAGTIAAVRRNSAFDYSSMIVVMLGVCTPSFWLGLMLMLLFAVKLDLFPTTGRGGWENLVLPAVTLGAGALVNHNFTPFIDTKPGVPADQKYKALGGIAFQPHQSATRLRRAAVRIAC